MNATIKEVARLLKGSLPFAIVDPNPKNPFAGTLSYKSKEEVPPTQTIMETDGAIEVKGELKQNDVVITNSDLLYFTIDWPSHVSQTLNAHKIYFVDTQNTKYCWDWEAAKKYSRNKSWYNENGAPPTHGAWVIENDQSSISWINRNYETDGVNYFTEYIKFEVNSNNVASANIVEAKFVDFKMFLATATDGVIIVDFLQDRAYKVNNSGTFVYNGPISDRNNNLGWLQLATDMALVNANVSAIDAVRDPDNEEDSYARPLHYWAAGTTSGVSLQKPSSANDGFIYDSSNTETVFDISMVGSTLIWSTDSTDDTVRIRENFTSIGADAWTNDHAILSTQTDWKQTIFSGTVILSDLGAGYLANGKDALLIGSNEGISLRHGLLGSGSEIGVTSSYVTPLMVGTRVVAYPLHDLNDRSGNSKTLTNNNGVTFSAGAFGDVATFDGTTKTLSRTADAALAPADGDFTISFMFKSSSNNNPLADEYLLVMDGTNDSISVKLSQTTGYLDVTFSDDALSTSDVIDIDYDLYNNKRHHIAIQKTGLEVKVFIDGMLSKTQTLTAAVDSLDDITDIEFGGNNGASCFNGQIEMFSYSKSLWSVDDVEFEYNRLKAAQAATTTRLVSNDVKSIQVDNDSGYAIIVTGTFINIMDIKTGLIYGTDEVYENTLNHGDIISMPESVTPHYLLGGSTTIEQVAPQTTVLNGGVPLTENQGPSSLVLNPFFAMNL